MSTISTAASDPTGAKPQTTPRQQAVIFVGTAGGLLLFSWSYPPLWFRDLITFGPLAWAPVAYLLYRRGDQVSRKIAGTGIGVALIAALVAAFRISDLHVVDWARGLLLSALFAGLAVAGLRRLVKRPALSEEAKAKLSSKAVRLFFVVGALFLGAYGYSLFGLINEQFDATPPRVSQAPVMRKLVSRTRGISAYEVILASDHGGPPAQYRVSSRAYRGLAVGQPACVNLHSGALGARWILVEPCAGPDQ